MIYRQTRSAKKMSIYSPPQATSHDPTIDYVDDIVINGDGTRRITRWKAQLH